MISLEIRKEYREQFYGLLCQIPLTTQEVSISNAIIEHYHCILFDLEGKAKEDLSKFQIPDHAKFDDFSYHTDVLRAKLGSLVGYLDSAMPEEKKEGSVEIYKIISGIQRTLRKLFRAKPNSEKDLLDKLEDLFNASQNKFRREQDHIAYSCKTYIPDFTFEEINCVVEGKLCNTPRREKELVAEINDDVKAYATRYENLIFVVYDTGGYLRDEERFRRDIASENVILEIIKH